MDRPDVAYAVFAQPARLAEISVMWFGALDPTGRTALVDLLRRLVAARPQGLPEAET